ncbi:MAG: AAA family ATPase [Catenulispora sp.]|nr:AAA family ATPase [Catenulispora sp.]
MPLISPTRFDGPLVGRDAEVARIGQVVDALRSGRGTVLEIVGDPGMGKTSLLAVLAGMLGGSGVRLARGQAVRGDVVPGQLFRSAWEEHPALNTPGLRDGPDRDAVSDPHAARALATSWAAGSGGAVLLDDVQWCDPTSVEIAVRLVRNPVAGPFLLALSHRPRQTSPALLDALDDGVRLGTVTRIEVPPLTADAMCELAGRWAGGSAANATVKDETHDRRLADAAGGSPRNLRILLAAGWDPVLWPFQAGGDPGGLVREAAALTSELDHLSPQAGAVLRGAAVLGDSFRPEDVAEVCGLPTDSVLTALGELSQADLVRQHGSGGFAFRDPVLAHIAHQHSSLAEQSVGHRRALDLLVRRESREKRENGAAPLARHAEHLLGTDSATAAPILARAAAEVVARDPAAAAHWSGLALDYLPHGGQTRAELEILRCRALIAVGRLDEARALVHMVLGHVAELPWQIALRAYGAAADVERLLCRYPEAEAIAATALSLLPAPELGGALPIEAVTMIYEYALVQSMRGDHVQAREMIRTAVDVSARPTHPTEVAIRCLAVCEDAYLGDVADAVKGAQDCAGAVDALADPQAGQAPEMFATLGIAEFYLERFDDASRHLQRGLKVASGGTQLHVVLHQLLGLAVVDLFTGRLETITQWAVQAEQLATAIGSQEGVGLAKSVRASAMIWTRGRRDVREILALAESAIADVEFHHSWWTFSALGLAAQVQLLGGDPEGALRTMLERADGRDVAAAQPALEPSLKALMAMAAIRCGDLAAARRWTEDAEAAATRLALGSQTASALRARAALHLADGRPELAVDLFAQAADRFNRAGAQIQRAWTQEMGAAAADAVQGTDAALPARPHADGPLGMLTDREREIAALAAAGLRSREIAQQLFLSPRTVEAHLGRVYRRLGVSSRGELPRIIGSQGGQGGGDDAVLG